VKTTHETAQNTIPKTSKSETKRPYFEGVNAQVLAESASFPEQSLRQGFQHQNTCAISIIAECKRRLKRKKIPEYRLISNYYKSTTQYWKERNRRKQEWKLYSEGLNYQQIGEKLGVSAKTVSHDLKKVFAYYKGQIAREIRLVREARDAEYMEQLNRLTPAERRIQLRQNFHVLSKLMQVKQRTQSTLNITINIDEFNHYLQTKQRYGRPLISVSPHKLYTRFSDLKLHFQFRIGDEILPYGTLTMGKAS